MSHIAPGEPIFTLRGQDPDAPSAIRWWAALKTDAGAPVEVVEPALAMADVLEAWPHKKPTDGDATLDPAARRELVRRLERRQRRLDVESTCGFCLTASLLTKDVVRGPGQATICRRCVEQAAELLAAKLSRPLARDPAVLAEGRSL